ncbi:hypothetical protein J2S10_004511 [Neobacillus ginsengisoli]|uniref:Uncharacterized protein n=1 Tax=Neobacillus ginsengisoli TaxID=904295 RepID=A0ABT9Y0F0_9BACI|nr:hypothetical protein [Neobacillus ginsengisoli]
MTEACFLKPSRQYSCMRYDWQVIYVPSKDGVSGLE